MFRLYAFITSLLGAFAVVIGAFGAHGVSDPRAHGLIDTGAHYHLAHALAAFAAIAFWRWGAPKARFAAPLFLAGICLFSGSLYALALGAPSWAGAITPIGGLCFVGGWGILAWSALTLTEPAS